MTIIVDLVRMDTHYKDSEVLWLLLIHSSTRIRHTIPNQWHLDISKKWIHHLYKKYDNLHIVKIEFTVQVTGTNETYQESWLTR